MYGIVCCMLALPVLTLAVSSTCNQEQNCRLPDCFCSTYQHPTIRNSSNIPQIVYFGFDDALTTVLPKYYDTLFPMDRRNPNGCPIGMTLYVSHQYTSYPLVKKYYKRGMEIAVHSVTHSHIKTRSAIMREASQQKRNIAKNSGIPSDEIIGWRSPFLETAGDAQADVLQKLGYKYDISLTYKRSSMNAQNPFPFTLDFGWTFYCQIRPCPLQPHKGFWEFPVNSMIDYKGQYPCGYVDGCYNAPKSEDDAFKYLYNNFLSAYNGNRAPFGLHMHAGWFYTQFHLNAMDRFIKEILTRDDVYIVTTKQALDWMKNPKELRDIKHFQPWSCANQIVPTRPKTTPTTTSTTTTTTPKPTTKRPTIRKPITRLPDWLNKPVPTMTKFWQPRQTWAWPNNFKKPFGFIQQTRRTVRIPAIKITTPKATTKAPTTTTTTTTTTTQPTTTTTRTTTRKPTTTTTTATTTTTTIPTTTTTTTQKPTTTVLTTTTLKPTTPPRKMDTVITRPRIPPNRWMMGSNIIPGNADGSSNIGVSLTAANNLLECRQGRNCVLPSCSCAESNIPGNLNAKDIPQMVYLSFEGDINSYIHRKYERLLFSGRRNPNQCPISATFFVSEHGAHGSYVKRLHNIGGEIAMMGYTAMPFWTANAIEDEIRTQISELRRLGIYDVKGWRSPNLKPYGDYQFQELHSAKFAYDATLTLPRNNNGQITWPHTLDFGWNNNCTNTDCPKKKYPGLWEVATEPIMDYLGRNPCDYADGCMIPPSTVNETFNMLWQGFLKHYQTNKAPYGLNFRHIWFSHPFFNHNVQGLEMFLDRLGSMKDVYVLPIRDVIDWIRHPTPISKLKNSGLWNCRK